MKTIIYGRIGQQHRAIALGPRYHRYRLAGMEVWMTDPAARRWQSGDLRPCDLCRSYIDAAEGCYSYITLARATSERLEPELAQHLLGAPIESAK